MRGGDWITYRLPPDPELKSAGIYVWRIGGDVYVGKAANLESRLREYLNNIRKIELGLPYRKGKPDAFREVHRALAAAKAQGEVVEWEVLEFCETGMRLDRERHWISRLKPGLNGIRRVQVEKTND